MLTSGSHPTASSSLIKHALQNDPQAWSRLTELYAPLVYHWVRERGLSPEDTADVVQDVFRAVFYSLKDCRRDSFRGWLWVITRNSLNLYFRKNANRPVAKGGSSAQQFLQNVPETLSSEVELSDQIEAERESTSSLVHRALELIRDDFEPTTWQAFWLTAVDNLEAPEAAKTLQMTPVAVRQAKYRVLTRLREQLNFM